MAHEEYLSTLRNELEKLGFECHPFKVEWYNAQVQPVFQLQYPPDTLAVSITSIPSMFEKTLIPFIMKEDCLEGKDPIDACIADHFQRAVKALPDISVDILYDYELDHMRRPKILVQTAGHVSGAAYYYQKKDLTEHPWDETKKIFGVSIHPKYGGWFAFRGVFILKGVDVDLKQPITPDPVPNNKDRVELLKRFNENWKDWSYRDIIPAIDTYSEEQKLYFSTPPKDRRDVVEYLKSKTHQGQSM